MITVGDLIKKLQGYDPKLPIYALDHFTAIFADLEDVNYADEKVIDNSFADPPCDENGNPHKGFVYIEIYT